MWDLTVSVPDHCLSFYLADDKVCDSCIVSSWALLIFLLCLWWWWPNSNFLCCVITQNGESSLDLLLSVTNRKTLAAGGWGGTALALTFCYLWLTEKLWLMGGIAPQTPPLKRYFYYYQSLSHNSTRSWGDWLGEKVSTLVGYLLTDGLNCLTVKYSAGWHLQWRASILKLVSFPVYLGCYALHYGIMYVSRLYTLYIQIVC